ncbi:MAG: hypothetical protein ACKOBG_12385 [Actinomycetota bacterium]
MGDDETIPEPARRDGAAARGADRARRRKRDGRHKARRNGARGRGRAVFDADALGAVRPVPVARLTVGTVIYAHLPHAEGPGSDARPAVITAVDGRTVTVFRILTHRPWQRTIAPVLVIEEWEQAGLNRPSRLDRRAVVIDAASVNAIVGELAEGDCRRNAIGPVGAGGAGGSGDATG